MKLELLRWLFRTTRYRKVLGVLAIAVLALGWHDSSSVGAWSDRSRGMVERHCHASASYRVSSSSEVCDCVIDGLQARFDPRELNTAVTTQLLEAESSRCLAKVVASEQPPPAGSLWNAEERSVFLKQFASRTSPQVAACIAEALERQHPIDALEGLPDATWTALILDCRTRNPVPLLPGQ